MIRFAVQFLDLDTGFWNDYGVSEYCEDAVDQLYTHLPGSKTVWRVVQRVTADTEVYYMRGENSL